MGKIGFLSEPEKRPQIGGEIASIDRDITRFYVGSLRDRIIESQDSILQNKGRGDLLLYEEQLTDSQVHSCYQQRFKGFISKNWSVEPASQSRADRRAADFIRELVECLPFDSISEKMAYAVHYGFSVAEKLLMLDDGWVTLDVSKGGIRVRNRRRFKFDADGGVRLLVPDDLYTGQVMHPSRVWKIVCGSDHDDDPYGRGLGHQIFWPLFFKRGDWRYWLRFLGKFASPTAVVVVPNGASPDEKAKAQELAAAVGDGVEGLWRYENTFLEAFEAQRSGTADYNILNDKCDAAISKIILSQTMTTDNGSSRSQAEVHQDVSQSIIEADSDLICQSFNDQVIAPLVYWNLDKLGQNAQPPRLWRQVEAEEDQNTKAERDTKLFAMNYRKTLQQIQEDYGEGYELIEQSAPEPARDGQQQPSGDLSGVDVPENGSGAVSNLLGASFSEAIFAERQKTTVDHFLERLQQQAQPELERMTTTIREALDSSEDLVEFREKLDGLYPNLNGEVLASVMAEAMYASRLAGLYESQEE